MSKVIRISEASFQRLQKLAEPLIDTPATVIDRLLDYYDVTEKKEGNKPSVYEALKASDMSKDSKYENILSKRHARQRGVTVQIGETTFEADSVPHLYEQVLKFICTNNYIKKLEPKLPLATSRKRYLLATKPVHPNGKDFFLPIQYKNYYMEAHKNYETAINQLKTMLEICGLVLTYIR